MEWNEKAKYYLCISDDDMCPEGYEGYIFPDYGFEKNINYCKEHNYPCIYIIEDIWKSEEEINDGLRYVKDVGELILEHISCLLNSYHNEDYSKDEWNILIGAWLFIYLQQLYDKYLRIRYIVQKNMICDCDVYSIKASDAYSDYLIWAEDVKFKEEYHKLQYSLVIDWFLHNNEKNITIRKTDDYHTERQTKNKFSRMDFRNEVYDLLFRIPHILLNKKDLVVLRTSYLPNKWLMRICFSNLGNVTNYIYTYKSERINTINDCDLHFRETHIDLASNDDFINLICRYIFKSIPKAYIEAFKEIKKAGTRVYKYALRPRTIIYSASSLFFDEIFKIYLMEIHKKRTSELCVVQHGGFYGIEFSENNNWEAEVSDCQYTWGWTKSYNGKNKCVPMPAAKLVGIKEKYNTSSVADRDVLYIDYAFPKHVVYLLDRYINFHSKKEEEISFLAGLKKDILNRTRVRLYPYNYGWNIKEEYTKKVPGIVFDNEKDIYKSISEAKLCITADFETTVLEALLLGKPCISYRPPTRIDDCASDIMKRMEEVGIVFSNWDKLNEQLLSVIDRVDEWWNEPERQSVVKEFCNRFVYAPDNARDIWQMEIMNKIIKKTI